MFCSNWSRKEYHSVVVFWSCLVLWTESGYQTFRKAEQVGPKKWLKERMEGDPKTMWGDVEFNMFKTFLRKRKSLGNIWQVRSIHWEVSHLEIDWFYLVCPQRAETGPIGERCRKVGFRRLGLTRVIDKRLYRQETCLAFPGGVQAVPACLAVMDMEAKILLWEGEQAENL